MTDLGHVMANLDCIMTCLGRSPSMVLPEATTASPPTLCDPLLNSEMPSTPQLPGTDR